LNWSSQNQVPARSLLRQRQQLIDQPANIGINWLGIDPKGGSDAGVTQMGPHVFGVPVPLCVRGKLWRRSCKFTGTVM
jgi:hypothetical protein